MPSEVETEEAGYRRLHPVSLLFMLGSAARGLLLPALAVFFASRGGNYEIWLVPFFGFAVISAFARYFSFRYRLNAEEMFVRHGIVTRNERHIPYARIQNIDLVQNLLHRLFGVAEVRLETAGGQKPEAIMKVLSLDVVKELRARVRAGREAAEVRGKATDGGVESEARPEGAPARLVHYLPAGEVALFGVISNRGMVVIAAVLGILGGIARDIDWEEQVSSRVKSAAPEQVEALKQFRPMEHPLTAVLIVLGVIVLGVIALRMLSVGWAFFTLHGFRLTRRGEDLRTETGLLTRVSKTIPRRRIQLLSIRQTLLHRWFSRAAIQVETAGSADEENRATGNRLWLAPLVRTEKVSDLVREALPEIDIGDVRWQGVSPRAVGRIFRKGLVVAGLVATVSIIGGLTSGYGWAGLIPAAIIVPLAWVHARLWVKHAAWAVTEEAVLYRSGWLTRRTSVTRFSKIQALQLRTTPFDRLKKMASVRVDTAGAGRITHGVAVTYLDAPVAAGLMRRLSDEAERVEFRW